MKIRLKYKDGHTEVSEHITALYADRYAKSQPEAMDYEIIDSGWHGDDYNEQEIKDDWYQF